MIDPTTPPGPLARAGLLEEASVYSAMWRASSGRMAPEDVRRLEIWQIAVLLGVSDEVTSKSSETSQTPDDDFMAHAKALSRQRLLHVQGKGPPPVPRPMPREEFLALTGTMGS